MTHLRLLRPAPTQLAALLLTSLGAFSLTVSASAQQFKVTATGKITVVRNAGGFYNSSVAIGTPYTFSFVFDYSAPNEFSGPGLGLYQTSAAGTGALITYGDYHFIPVDGGAMKVGHATGSMGDDLINLASAREATTGFATLPDRNTSFLQLNLLHSVLSSSALPPLSVYDLSKLSGTNPSGFASLLSNSNNTESSVEGSITSLSAELVAPAAVPEASTTVSLGVLLGLSGLTLVVRRRRVVVGK